MKKRTKKLLVYTHGRMGGGGHDSTFPSCPRKRAYFVFRFEVIWEMAVFVAGRMRASFVALISFSVILLNSPSSWAMEIYPAGVTITENLENAPAGFRVWTKGDGLRDLTFVEFFEGKPEARYSLETTSRNDADHGIENTWVFPKMDTGQGIWVGCHYAATGMTLTHELPNGLNTCRITYLSPKHGLIDGALRISTIRCS